MRPEIIAHRGARSLAPENTLLAAKKAFELGADLWETDVGVSKDGVPILMHDDALTRTTDAARRFPDRAPWTFTTFTLEELKALDAGSWFLDTDPFGEIARGAVSAEEEEAIRGAQIPALEEALRLTQALGWRVNIELKRQPPPMEGFPLLEAVFAVIDAVGIGPEAVVLSSFDLDLMRESRKMRPEFRVQAVLGFHRDRPIDWAAAADFDELNPRASLTPPAVVERLSKKGKAIRPWTVNEVGLARDLIAAGVAGLFTDYPQRLVPLVG